MNRRLIHRVQVLAATGLLLFGAAFVLTQLFSATSSKSVIDITPTLKASKYQILLPNASAKATIDSKVPSLSTKPKAFPRQI